MSLKQIRHCHMVGCPSNSYWSSSVLHMVRIVVKVYREHGFYRHSDERAYCRDHGQRVMDWLDRPTSRARRGTVEEG